jgi:hypothetical protein
MKTYDTRSANEGFLSHRVYRYEQGSPENQGCHSYRLNINFIAGRLLPSRACFLFKLTGQNYILNKNPKQKENKLKEKINVFSLKKRSTLFRNGQLITHNS